MSVYMLFTNILPEVICCCLETCNVYVVFVDVVLHNYVYKLSWPLQLTLGSSRYI